jgi:hypothetical protein
MKTIILTFAKGNPRYIHAARSQEESLRAKGYNGVYRCYDHENQLECPPHSSVPYAFKAFAIKKAFDEGYENIIWLDSVVQCVAPLDKLIAHVEETGYAFFNNYTYTIGSFCNDNCKEIYQLTDTELQAPMIMACVMGLNREKAKEFIDQYYEGALNGSFVGSWDNHRHDQTVASLLINRNNIPILQGHETFFMYYFMVGLEFEYNNQLIKLDRGTDVCLLSI